MLWHGGGTLCGNGDAVEPDGALLLILMFFSARVSSEWGFFAMLG